MTLLSISKISDDQTNASEVQAKPLVSAEISVTTAPIPITHVFNFSGESQIEEGEVWHDEGDYYYGDDNTYDDDACYYEDKGYYYRDRRYERKVSPLTSPIISPVTAWKNYQTDHILA
jgi:hypothetical protein